MARAKRKQHHSTHHSTSHSGHRNGGNGDHARRETEEIISTGREQMGRMQKSALDSFGVFSGPMSRIMDHNWSMFQRAMQTMQSESLRFFNRRLEHTSQVIENSRDFQGVSGLMHLHQEWILDFARDYSEQATRVAQLMREMAADSSEALEESEEELEENVREEEHSRRATA